MLNQCTLQRVKHAFRERIQGKSNGLIKLEQMLGFEVDLSYVNCIIWRQSNVPRIRAFWFKFFHCITRANVHYAAFGIKEDDKCNFCDVSPQTREHLYLHCETVRDFFRGMIDRDDFMTIIENWLQGNLDKTQAWLVGEMVYFTHAANFRGLDICRGTFLVWLKKVKSLQLHIAIEKNRVDVHARKWDAIQEELNLPI